MIDSCIWMSSKYDEASPKYTHHAATLQMMMDSIKKILITQLKDLQCHSLSVILQHQMHTGEYICIMHSPSWGSKIFCFKIQFFRLVFVHRSPNSIDIESLNEKLFYHSNTVRIVVYWFSIKSNVNYREKAHEIIKE